ncbi:MAG: 2-hydroxychromene-2-carboxylate isomerase [Alphaproteobacteria bacterium]|nr:2-hydroxychromene-2-carboxylate isomerase [Alphaproteobacteria bacterium]
MRQLEFFFDYASPWSYMAFTRIQALAADTAAQLAWRPLNMALLFAKANPGVAAMRATPVPAKVTHYYKDMKDWAKRLGIVIGRPPVYGGASKQLDSRLALRGALLALDRDLLPAYSLALYRAYWHDLRDLADPAALQELAVKAGLAHAAVAAALADPELDRRIAATVDDLVARGGFGVPTFFVNRQDMYFGNDRLDFVREALLAEPPGRPSGGVGAPSAAIATSPAMPRS